MPTYYPQIGSGIITALPYQRSAAFDTIRNELPSGQIFARSNLSNELGVWSVVHQALSNSDLETLRTFFAGRHGRALSFIFLDPSGNLVPFSEDFADASWSNQQATIGAAVTDPEGGNLATSVASTGSDAKLWTTILPDGDASGYILCGSVWARATGSSQQLHIAFLDSGPLIIGGTTFDLPQNQWVRIQHTITLATATSIGFQIGGLGTWASGETIQLFGAQAVPMPGPGEYSKSPGNSGLHNNCRFGSDEWSPEYVSAGINRIQIEIEEFGGG